MSLIYLSKELEQEEYCLKGERRYIVHLEYKPNVFMRLIGKRSLIRKFKDRQGYWLELGRMSMPYPWTVDKSDKLYQILEDIVKGKYCRGDSLLDGKRKPF